MNTTQDTLTVPQRRILNLLAIKGATLERRGFDRYYVCHPNLTPQFVHMNIATALIQAGYVAVERAGGNLYTISEQGQYALNPMA